MWMIREILSLYNNVTVLKEIECFKSHAHSTSTDNLIQVGYLTHIDFDATFSY